MVTPQAPLDVRAVDAFKRVVSSMPRVGDRPPSLREALEYSTQGDWTTRSGGVRALHALAVLVTFLVTWPLDWLLRLRAQPGAFVLALAFLILLGKVL